MCKRHSTTSQDEQLLELSLGDIHVQLVILTTFLCGIDHPRRAFDALDAQSNDDFLSLGEIATLSEAGELREYPAVPSPARASGGSSGGGRGGVPASPSLMPVVEADRLPLLAKTIERYLRRKGKQHLAFAEFVLLCRDLDVG